MILYLLLATPLASADCARVAYFRDADFDGYGTGGIRARRCDREGGYLGWSRLRGDCDDLDATRHPDAAEVCDGIDQDCDGDDGGCPTGTWVWGDLHGHTNLSPDGCEDELDDCTPVGATAGVDMYAEAEANGLSFAAITDHAEAAGYTFEGVTIDPWDEARWLVAEAEDAGAVVPILGYEWTSGKGHRTVLLEDPEACARYRIHASPTMTSKAFLGRELYTFDTGDAVTAPEDLMAALAAAGEDISCEPSRYVVFYHHPAYELPADVDWSAAFTHVDGDTVVEIASEHGSSECADLDADGCDFWVNEGRYTTSGSVQAALQAGLELGFVGGSDNHEARPGSMADGAGAVGSYADTDGDGIGDKVRHQYAPGAVTGVLVDGPLDRATIFDALEARHTVAATWAFEGLAVYAYDGAGGSYLPGDAVPAGTLTLVVELDDPTVSSWSAELVDPWGELSPVDEPLTLSSGDVRYVRVRAWVDGEEHRIWASPWFTR